MRESLNDPTISCHQSSSTETPVQGSLPSGWADFWQSESLICQWLATLYSAELDMAALEQYRAGAAKPLLALLRQEHQLEAQTERLESAVQGWVMLAEPRLELAADFASLFLTDTRAGAPPYASLYTELSGQFSGQALSRMQERLLQIGYAVKNELAEPADHLAVILDYLAARCAMLGALNPGEISADAAAEAETLAAAQVLEVAGELPLFLEQELLSWMPQFTARCQQVSVVSDFYPALAALTEAYLHRLPLSIRQEWLSQPSP